MTPKTLRVLFGPFFILLIGLSGGPRYLPDAANAATPRPSTSALIPITTENAQKVSLLKQMGGGWIYRSVWSPDGKTLAVPSTVGVWLYSTKNYQQTPTLLEGYRNIWYGRDGKYLALADRDNNLEVRDVATNQMLSVMEGHTAMIYDVAFSADDTTVLTAAEDPDNSVWVWDAHTGRQLASYSNFQNATFSRDGFLFAAGNSNGVSVWNVTTGKQQTTLQTTENFGCSSNYPATLRYAPGYIYQNDNTEGLVFSPDNSLLACINEYQVTIWSTRTGQLFGMYANGHDIHVSPQITSVAFSPDGTLFAVAGGEPVWDAMCLCVENGIWLWDLRTGKKIMIFHGHNAQVNTVDFTPDGKKLVSSSYDDGTIRVWDLTNGRQIEKSDHRSVGLALSPDGKSLAAWDSKLVVQDVTTGRVQAAFDDYAEVDRGPFRSSSRCFRNIQFNRQGNFLLTADGFTTVRLWDLTGIGQPIVLHVTGGQWTLSIALNLTGSAVVTDTDGNRFLWNPASKQQTTLDADDFSFSPDGSTLAYIDRDRKVKLRNLRTQQEQTLPIEKWIAPDRYIYGLTYSPDGSLLAILDDHGTVTLWDLAAQKLRGTLGNDEIGPSNTFDSSGFTDMAFSPDGSTLALYTDTVIQLWDIKSLKRFASVSDVSIANDLIFSPDSTTVAWVDPGVYPQNYPTDPFISSMVHVWNFRTDKSPKTLRDPLDTGAHTNPLNNGMFSDGCSTRTPAFNADGKLLAAISNDGTLQLWNVSTGKILTTFMNERDLGEFVTGIAVSEDGTVRLWGIKND